MQNREDGPLPQVWPKMFDPKLHNLPSVPGFVLSYFLAVGGNTLFKRRYIAASA
jgi:hypothetical protein